MNAFPKKIAVLKGGPSAERDVSLRSGSAAAEALRESGFEVTEVTVEGADFLLPPGTELAFLALHGTFGEDGQVQDILTSRGVPFTGANAAVSRIAFDKEKTKDKFRTAGVPTPEGQLVSRVEEVTLSLPLFVKPNEQGSSVGTHPATTRDELDAALAAALEFGPRALVERFIRGRELTVGVLGDEPMPIIEIHPLDGFYDYTNKYTKGRTEYFCPAPLPEDLTRTIQRFALAAHQSLGATVYSRVDFLLEGDSHPYCLEVNTLPGMTATSLLPKAAAAIGLSFAQLCHKIVELSWTARREEQGG